MRGDPYKSFAERYDWMYRKNPERETFFRRIFEQFGVSNVLDCACGTGHDLIMLHSLGFHVAGSDLSDAMLAQAEKNLSKAGIDIPVKKADFRELEKHYPRQFDAVVCLTNAINEILEETEVRRAFASMTTVLRAGGILVLDQGQSDFTMRNPPEFTPVVNTRDFSRLFVLEYSGSIMRVHIFDFEHTENKNAFFKDTVDVAIRLKDDWDRILAQAVFANVAYFGDFNFSPYDRDSSQRLIAVAEKGN